MKLIEMSLSNKHVRIRYADDTDPNQASEWIDVRLKLADLTHPSGTPLPLDPINLTLASIQAAVLRELRTRADDEIRSLEQSP